MKDQPLKTCMQVPTGANGKFLRAGWKVIAVDGTASLANLMAVLEKSICLQTNYKEPFQI